MLGMGADAAHLGEAVEPHPLAGHRHQPALALHADEAAEPVGERGERARLASARRARASRARPRRSAVTKSTSRPPAVIVSATICASVAARVTAVPGTGGIEVASVSQISPSAGTSAASAARLSALLVRRRRRTARSAGRAAALAHRPAPGRPSRWSSADQAGRSRAMDAIMPAACRDRPAMSRRISAPRADGPALECDLHRRRAALRLAVEDGLDIVAVGIEQEGGVIAGMIVARSPGAPLSVPPAARPGLVEGIDRRLVLRLEGEVRWRPVSLPSAASLSAVETTSSSAQNMPSAAAVDRDVEHAQDRLVEAAAGVQIAHDQLDMIDQPAAMQFACRISSD